MSTKIYLFAIALATLGGCAELENMRNVLEAGVSPTSSATPRAGSVLQIENATLEFRDSGSISLRYQDQYTIERLSLKAEDADVYLAGFNRWIDMEAQARAQGLRGFEAEISNVSDKRVDLGGGMITGGVPANFPITMVFRVSDRGAPSLIVKGRGAYDFYSAKTVPAFAELLRRRGEARAPSFQFGSIANQFHQ